MKTIKELTDASLLGREGLSDRKPRLAARAILRRRDGKYALMYIEKFDLYCLPGGGVEKGEKLLCALQRELHEETGCSCDKVRALGCVTENRACHDFVQKSFYFAVKTEKPIEKNNLTDKEKAVNVKLLWVNFSALVEKISYPKYDTEQKIYIQARDTAALEEYSAWMNKRRIKYLKNSKRKTPEYN